MKKLFLIPLLTLLTCVMAFAEDRHVTDITGLKAAVADASVETIYLDQDIEYYDYAANGVINVLRSVTIDGQGHTLYGAAQRGTSGNYPTLAINQGGTSMVDVVLKNIQIINPFLRAIETRGNINSLTIENSYVAVEGQMDGYTQAITIGGNQASAATINIANSTVKAPRYYPIIVFNPVNMTLTNTNTIGWCALYFKGADSSEGSHGSVIEATACNFDAVNTNSGLSNAFAAFVYEDDGISITLDNCGMNAEHTGDQSQFVFALSELSKTTRRAQNINITIKGDNSHINGKQFLTNNWIYKNATAVTNHTPNIHPTATITAKIYGGTYSINPELSTYCTGNWSKVGDEYSVELTTFEIPDGYEVKEITMEGVATPLYRVVKKAEEKEPGVMYDLNDNVQSQGDGQNPTTSFELSDGSAMTLNQATTKAGYVEVSNATIVTVATDQTLVINNGLDVQGASSVVTAQPGSALVIGEGGIVTESSANIVVEANEDGAASLLLDPTITVNQTPELTVKMTVPAEHAGYEMLGSEQYRHWFRFAMPVEHMDATWAKEPNVPTYLYGWNYSAQEWAQVGVTEMVPFAGYTLSPDKEISTNTAVTYTFKGKLLGNTNCTLNLNHHGYNFFGNSYTGYISILKLVEQIMGDAKIDGTVWMWDGEKYQGVALEYVRNYGEIPGLVPSWQKEVAPMQTFVLRLTGSEFSSTDINYADAIWGNPRYDNAKSALNAAPARQAEINDNAIISMSISANGQKESIVLIENGVYSDAYDRGYDAIKYMNENSFNTYVGVNGENYGTVATDNLDGKMLSIKTNNELAYSVTFDFVAGEEYALRDNLTGNVIAIEEGATYEFAAQPNSTVEGRFEIVSVAKMPTAIENTEVKTNVKGIYTLTGQYVGENFEALPAGVYVVNGVKIVK